MKVSVCLAAYNGEKYIQEQIKSIQSQINKDDEIIIGDDCSTDKTRDLINAIDDSRIKLIENKKNVGLIKNFENLLKKASGDVIFLSDQDDIWLENKLSIFASYLRKYDVVQSDAYVVDETKKIINSSYFALRKVKGGFLKNIWKNNYTGCNMAFNRKILEIALPFPRKIPMHDLWIGMIGELFFKTSFIPKQLLLYRRHSQTVSTSEGSSKYSFFRKLLFRINTLRYLPLLIYRRLKSNNRF